MLKVLTGVVGLVLLFALGIVACGDGGSTTQKKTKHENGSITYSSVSICGDEDRVRFTSGRHFLGSQCEDKLIYAWENAIVHVSGNTTVYAADDAVVYASGNAYVSARDNVYIEVWQNARAEVSGNVKVLALGYARVFASGNSSVEARDAVRVLASDNAQVTVFEHATVERK